MLRVDRASSSLRQNFTPLTGEDEQAIYVLNRQQPFLISRNTQILCICGQKMYICLYFYSERRTRQKEGITTKLNAGSWNRNRKWSTASVPRKRQSLSWNYWNMSYLQAYLRLFRKNAAVKDDFTAFIYSDQPGFWIRTINRNTSGHK